MKDEYSISRLVLVIIAPLIFVFLYRKMEALSIFIPLVIAIITFVASFPSTIVCKKIISTGEKINNKIFRVLYYIVLLIGSVLLSYLIVNVLSIMVERHLHPKNFGDAISQAIIALIVIESLCVAIILPYVQSLIVLVIRFINNSKPRS